MAMLSAPAAPPSRSVSDTSLRQASRSLGVPFVDLRARSIRSDVLRRLPEAVARATGIVVYDETRLPSGRTILRLAVADPAQLETEAPEEIRRLHERDDMVIEVALTDSESMEAALTGYRKSDTGHQIPESGRQGKEHQITRHQDSHRPGGTQSDKSTSPQLPTVDLRRRTIPREVLERIPEETARKYRVAVFDVLDQGRTIHIAVEKPDNPQVRELLDFIERQNHLKLVTWQASAASIDHALKQYQPSRPPVAPKPRVVPVKKETAVPKPPSVPKAEKPSVETRALTPIPSASIEEPSLRKLRATQPNKSALRSPIPVLPAGRSDLRNPASAIRHPASEAPAVVRPEDLTSPDLHVPKTADVENAPLIPIAADVEHDMRALVGGEVTDVAALEAIVKTGFIPKIVGAILLLAVEREASDVHIQATTDTLVVRYRLDGMLSDIIKMPISLQAPIMSRIKILARLKIDEARIPQDGRFDISVGERAIDLRVSTFPTVYGEKVVLRLLDKSAGLLKFEILGLVGSRLTRLREQMRKPYGVILATGPTGSGKSTLLYAVLGEIATPAVNVVTLEDPVEYEIAGIAQSQIQPKIGFGFAEGLRSILRQDPNIIMVGEIRDLETAGLVTHAALTGHLVLSTLHTNDAAGALPRLINMGVEPFLITSAMNAIVAQRLVRKLCEKCRIAWEPSAEVLEQVRVSLTRGHDPELAAILKGGMKLWKTKGCSACHDGYKGRVGLFEVLVMSDKLETLAVKRAPASELADAAVLEGMVTMEQDGLVKALAGQTTLDEVWRVTKTE